MANHPLKAKADKLIANLQRRNSPLNISDLRTFADELVKFQFDEIKSGYTDVLNLQLKLSKDVDTLKKFHNFMPSGYVVIDKEGTIQHINTTMCEMLGINKGYARRHHFTEFLLMENVNKFMKYVGYIIQNRLNVSFETEMMGHNKKFFYANLKCAPEFEKMGEEYCTIVIQDVTNKKNQEKELLTSIENLNQLILEKTQELEYEHTIRLQVEGELQSTITRLSALIENLDVGVLLEDNNQKVSIVNQKFLTYFKMDVIKINNLFQVPAKEIWETIQYMVVDTEEFIPKINSIIFERTPIRHQSIIFKDGRTFDRDYIPINIENNQFLNLWLFRDITYSLK
ncbi:MAG: PAS domain-containing protein [Leptospiraceae bacterium]|nr:PAS domain-containing protein [Leptospiraceae bacterium]MCP5496959.1 PAS domain-containing protein [Leptospiraceae bacterium]